MRIADNKIDALELSNFFRRALSVATCDNDERSGIRSMNLAHRLACLRVSRRRHRTSVQHYDIRARMLFDKRKPVREEIPPQRRGIRVRSAATKVFDRKYSHAINWMSLRENARRNYSSARAYWFKPTRSAKDLQK